MVFYIKIINSKKIKHKRNLYLHFLTSLNEPYGSALLDQILNDYPKFTKKLSQALSSLLHSSSIHIPERLLYVYPTMKHFPFFEVPLGDHEYKHYLLSKKRGKLINFNFIQVLKV